MITKEQAVVMRQTYIRKLPDRIDAAITAAAIQGGTTITVSYDPAGNGVAQQLRDLYIANGWSTSSINTTAKTITIAP